MAKTTFKLGDIEIAVNGNPVTIKGFEFTTEATAQELATSGSNINKLVELIGDIAEHFDNGNHTPEPVKEIEVKEESKPVKAEAVKVSESDFREIKPKKSFNITKAWRAIPVPKIMKQTDVDQYRWEGEKGLLSDSVTVDGDTYGVVYIHIKAMHKKSFIIVRPENVKFEDDVKPEEFQDFLEAINIPTEIKDYIQKVIEL